MLQILKSEERGAANHGWLKSQHSFSFADYYNPKQMGFRSLRVINEDHIAGGMGFGSHPHKNMEIITYVISGVLEHKDSMGTQSAIRPGEVQRMTAGTGVVHSEYNKQPEEEVHLLQIWILPKQPGGNPGYDQKTFAKQFESQKMTLVVSGTGREGSLSIQQDADLYIGKVSAGDSLEFPLREGRGLWLQMVRGAVEIEGKKIGTGDAFVLEHESQLKLKSLETCEFLLFDLA